MKQIWPFFYKKVHKIENTSSFDFSLKFCSSFVFFSASINIHRVEWQLISSIRRHLANWYIFIFSFKKSEFFNTKICLKWVFEPFIQVWFVVAGIRLLAKLELQRCFPSKKLLAEKSWCSTGVVWIIILCQTKFELGLETTLASKPIFFWSSLDKKFPYS